MPGRFLNAVAFNTIVGMTGLFGTFLGFAIQENGERHAANIVARQAVFDAMPDASKDAIPYPPAKVQAQEAVSEVYTGKAIAVASAFATALVMIGKSLIDFFFYHRSKRVEIQRLESQARIENEKRDTEAKIANDKLESEAKIALALAESEARIAIINQESDARSQADSAARREVLGQLEAMAKDLGAARAEIAEAKEEAADTRLEAEAARHEATKMAEILDKTREELADARKVILHADKGMAHTRELGNKLIQENTKSVRELLRGQEEIRTIVAGPSQSPPETA